MMSNEPKEQLLDDNTGTNDDQVGNDDLQQSLGAALQAQQHLNRSMQSDEYSHHEVLDSPPSPKLNYTLNNSNGKPRNKQMTLSKKLFNLEHYIMIPLMFLVSFFVYFDRGGLSSALNKLECQLFEKDNDLKGGIVASSYLFGYCFTSPIFAYLGSHFPPLKMSAMGMFVWCIGCILTGVPSPSYISDLIWLAGSRLLTGIGEGSFLAFAGTIIDIIAPNNSRSMWLGTFYMGIPLGYAMGYGVGGSIVDMSLYTTDECIADINDNGKCSTDLNLNCNESWRGIFIFETFLVLPICIILYCIKQPANMLIIKQAKDELDEEAIATTIDSNISIPHLHKEDLQQDSPMSVKLVRLFKNPTFVLTSIGYALQTFVTGTFAVEAIAYLQTIFPHWSDTKAGTIFGGLTFVSGVTGSIFGGYILDKLKLKVGDDEPVYKYCKPSLKLLAFFSFISFPFAFLVVLFNHVGVFVICVALTEFFIFASTGPVNSTILWCVLYEDRPLAAALNTLLIHALGDACAPIVVGAIIDAQTNAGHTDKYSYNFAFGIAVFWLIFSGIAFTAGCFTMNWLEKWMIQQGQTRRKTSLLINDPSH